MSEIYFEKVKSGRAGLSDILPLIPLCSLFPVSKHYSLVQGTGDSATVLEMQGKQLTGKDKIAMNSSPCLLHRKYTSQAHVATGNILQPSLLIFCPCTEKGTYMNL